MPNMNVLAQILLRNLAHKTFQHAIFMLQSHWMDIYATISCNSDRIIRPYFANMSNECRATHVQQLRDIFECLTTFAQISLSFACFLKTAATVVNLSHCRFATISQVRDSRTNVVRLLSKRFVANKFA